MADAVESHICAPVTPTSTKGRKSLKDDSDNSIDDFIVDEFRAHREAAMRRHKRESLTSNVDTNLYTHRKKIEPKSSQGVDRERKGHCPTCDRKRGFGMVEADDMANELMGVVMHVDDLLDEAHEALREVKTQFWAVIWEAERWEKKHGESWSKLSRRK